MSILKCPLLNHHKIVLGSSALLMQCLTGHNNNKIAINTGLHIGLCSHCTIYMPYPTRAAIIPALPACQQQLQNDCHTQEEGCVCASETRQKCRVCVLDFFLPTTLDSSEALTELLSAGKIIYLQTTSPSLSFHCYQSPSVHNSSVHVHPVVVSQAGKHWSTHPRINLVEYSPNPQWSIGTLCIVFPPAQNIARTQQCGFQMPTHHRSKQAAINPIDAPLSTLIPGQYIPTCICQCTDQY